MFSNGINLFNKSRTKLRTKSARDISLISETVPKYQGQTVILIKIQQQKNSLAFMGISKKGEGGIISRNAIPSCREEMWIYFYYLKDKLLHMMAMAQTSLSRAFLSGTIYNLYINILL
jgi:hypothetical protein